MVSQGNGLSQLVGEELAGVHFVRDYVEFSFDGPLLRALSSPIVQIQGECATFPAPGSRDLLCALIADTVTSAEEQREALVVQFAGGGEVRVPLRDDSGLAEIAVLIPARTGREPTYEPTVYWENKQPSKGV